MPSTRSDAAWAEGRKWTKKNKGVVTRKNKNTEMTGCLAVAIVIVINCITIYRVIKDRVLLL